MSDSIDSASTKARVPRWPQRYRLVALCFAAVFICYIDRVNISVAALAMQETHGWSETTKGLVLSAFFVGYMLFQIPSGYLTKRYGGKRVLGVAVVWWSIFTILTPVVAALPLPVLIAVRIAMGLGEAAMFPAAYGMLSRWVPAAERSRSVSVMQSGIPLGTLFGLVATGWIIVRFDWPTVFYVFGTAGFIWAPLWFSRVHDDPASHPRASIDERLILAQNGLETIRADEAAEAIPWTLFLTKPALWALLVNHFCSTWTLYMLLAWLPSYFRDVQGLNIASAGFFSAAPWLTMFLMLNVGALLADTMVRHRVTLTVVRKVMQVVGLLGSATFLLLARDIADATTAQLLMCGALGALALCWSGFATNHLDVAPRHASLLMGVTNTAGTIPGVIGVAVTGWLVEASGSYSTAFLLAAGVSVFGAIVWLVFGTGKRVID